jgi:hypothetical protein
MNTHAFDNYRDGFENVKRKEGILDIGFHTRGGPLMFNGYVHEALVPSATLVVLRTGLQREFVDDSFLFSPHP